MNNISTVTIEKAASAVEIIYRSLCADDAEEYMNLRTKALTEEDCRAFVSADPQRELNLPRSDWQKVCTEKADQTGRGEYVAIGAFCYGKDKPYLVGSSLIERWSGDETGQTAFYRAIYVHPDFRKMGVGEKIELMQDDWARRHGYTKAVFTVRADKKEWLARQINRFEASIVGSNFLHYANGERAFTYYLERHMRPMRLPRPQPILAFAAPNV